MKQRNLDEEKAYIMLRDMAMQRKVRIADLANQLVEAAKMLIAVSYTHLSHGLPA